MVIINSLVQKTLNRFYYLQKNTIELNNIDELLKVFGWSELPILDRPDIYEYNFIEDANQRRIRDAEALAAVMRNSNPKIALEIGTSTGMGTVLMAVNSPHCTIHTINIPPEEIHSGEGGKFTTVAIERDKIGYEYKKRDLKNIVQIFANTAKWEPNIGEINVAFIDGCHDTKFVYNDTRKVLKHCSKNSFILWHDFNLQLINKFNWINDVCRGIENLYRNGYMNERIFHIKDSWIGICKLEK